MNKTVWRDGVCVYKDIQHNNWVSMIEYLDQVVDKDQYRCSLYVEYTVRVGH